MELSYPPRGERLARALKNVNLRGHADALRHAIYNTKIFILPPSYRFTAMCYSIAQGQL